MNERQKKIVAAISAVLAVGVATYVVISWIRTANAAPDEASRRRTLVCSQTDEVFTDVVIPKDAHFPLKNPKTGSDTLFIPEACYWTKDGKAKLSPTWVLLNQFKGKTGPTICPDCGREVRTHNPQPPAQLMIDAAEAAKK